MTDDATAAARAALDAATAALAVTPAERRAVRAYQALAGNGAHLNRLLRGEPAALADTVGRARSAETLDGLLRRSRLPVDLVLHRGVLDPSVLPDLGRLPAGWSTPEFVSTSLSRAVAVEAADGGVVLRLLARRGRRGVWLPPVGYARLAYEQEVLLPRGSFFALYAWRSVDGLVEIHSEVM